jgi:tetratricopeptide (TPR) repeat protein
MARPHVQLAALADWLGRSEPRQAYLRRACRLRPSDAGLWYQAGVQDLLAGDRDQAWECWQNSLRCSARFLPKIVERGSQVLDFREIPAKLLPDRPDYLFQAAYHLYPGSGVDPRRRVFLKPALALLRRKASACGAQDFCLQAQIHQALDQPTEAAAAYGEALARAPLESGWRLERAKLLYQLGQLKDCQHELGRVVRDQPGNTEARELLRAVIREQIDAE